MRAEKQIGMVQHSNEERLLKKSVTDIELQAQSISIKTDDDYRLAGDFGRMLKQRTYDVKAFWKPMKEAAHKAHVEICSKEKEMLAPLQHAEKILKQAMGKYLEEEEEKRKLLEEEAKKAAQVEVNKKIDEAIIWEEKGDLEAANSAVNEAEMMDRAISSISVVKPARTTGTITKKDWVITKIDRGDVPIEFNGQEIRPVDLGMVMKIIRETEGHVNIPGIEFKETMQVSFRR